MTAKGKSIVSKGKTVKEAVAIALDLLNVTLEDADIEIIENESKGILGLGARSAQVRVTSKVRTMATPSFADLEDAVRLLDMSEKVAPLFDLRRDPTETNVGGMVWVLTGEIRCKDAPDKFPLLSPGKGIILYKNDELVERTVTISEGDVLKVELEDEEQPPLWELAVSENKMEATLSVTPGFRLYRRLKDKQPDSYIELEVEETKVPIIIDTRPIMEKLQEIGVVHGVDYSQLALACTSDKAGSFIIARGTAPTPGTNGYFMPIQSIEIKKGLKERPDGSVDYREIQEFPSVERGQVIGIVKPPVPGIPGTTVTNESVLPPEVFPLVVREGKGVALVDDQNKVIATDAGHPEIKIKGSMAKISVTTKLMIGKDVDLQTGNVHYSGDIEILGSIQDGMLVNAQGNVLVHQNVNMAKLAAGSSIIVSNNIVTSEITAGKGNILVAEINETLPGLIQQMKQMVDAINQLSNVSAFKVSSFTRTGLGPLLKILYDGKFKTFAPMTLSLVNKIKSAAEFLDNEWTEFSDKLYRGFYLTPTSDLRSVDEVVQIIMKAETLFENTRPNEDEHDCFIKAISAHNSQLFSSGDISIIGKGVYNSTLWAGGFIIIDGYVRGGEIYSKKCVKIREAGTRGGTYTKITVPKDGTITINTVMEDTVIQIGSRMHKFPVESSNVFARLDEDGQLQIS